MKLQSWRAALWSHFNSGDAKLVQRILMQYATRYWVLYAFGFVAMGIAAACTALAAYLMGNVVNEAYLSRDFSAVAVLCIFAIGIFAAKGLSTYAQSVLLAKVANRITAENQTRIVDKLVQEGVGYFSDRHSSEFMASAVYSAGSVGSCLNILLTAVGRDVLSLIALATVMVSQDPFMSIGALFVLPPAVAGVRKLIRRVKTIALTQFSGTASILQTLQETIQGFRIVKAFNLEDRIRAKVQGDISSVERAANKMARVSNRATPMMETLGGCAIALAFLYGGYRVIELGAKPGEFVSFISAFLLAYEPAKRIARVNIELGSNLVGVQILFGLLDSEPAEKDDSYKPSLNISSGRLELNDVHFAYRTNEPVLRGTTFIAAPCRVTALIGPSGGGKSTIFSLILRFYEPQAGSISIDAQDTTAVSRKSVREQIAYVGQDVFLFRGTIRENIACGRPSAGEDEVVSAANAAFAHDFIMSFPMGYDTQVGELGVQLSLGQRQRVAIARALIKNAPIILLDEPTASLDSESEQKVQDAIRRLCAKKTTLVIAHRLNTVLHADCIHVIEHGTVFESGDHRQLMAQNGRYATLFKIQFGAEHRVLDKQAVVASA